ncbi:MAG TPA: YiiD C-terminal domain-containing protein [Woeseiaceae bacterium]|nr:YiiD C-terminal domain-containing protein [Woeseiaceae bacterium]
MSPAELEHYLHEHIPLSRAMQLTVLNAEDGEAVLAAPLGPNINHRETAFGGSVSALAILAAWSLLHVRLGDARTTHRLVIQRNTMDYRLPIRGQFIARASLTSPEHWERFQRTLARRGRARITVSSVIEHAGQTAACFRGEFVAATGASPTLSKDR